MFGYLFSFFVKDSFKRQNVPPFVVNNTINPIQTTLLNEIIKKGVDQRIDELSDGAKTSHPKHRPPYVRILPLAQVISLATGFRTLTSKRIIQMWNGLVKEFETEISVLLDAEISKIIRFDAEVGRVIDLFRRSRMNYIAGGGGMYGRPTLKKEKDRVYSPGQKTLDQY